MAYVFFVCCTVLCLLEIVYRYQWIDFYRTEFNALNKKIPDNCKNSVLIFGDSFSAQPNGYVDQLRDEFPNTCIYNASVPGTGIIQTSLLAKRRLNATNPKLVIYQMYLGNDLIDIHHPINWSELGVVRNLYWWISDRFRVLAYINQKLGQVSHSSTLDIDKDYDSKNEKVFSVDKYSSRTKLYLKSDPYYLEKSVGAATEYSFRIKKLIDGIGYLRAKIPDEVPLVIMPIPHCSQLGGHYYNEYLKLGAKFDNKKVYLQEDYALLSKLKKHFKNEDIVFLNPLPALSDQDSEDKRLYFANDPHLNKTGHQVLKQFLTPILHDYLP